MISKRCLYTIMLGAMLALAANLMPSSDAQAMKTSCCCSAEECRCSGCSQHAANDSVPVLQLLSKAAADTCTCSTGPNPFDTDEASPSSYLEPTKKHLSISTAASTSGVHYLTTAPHDRAHKPPAVSRQCLYLLNNSFRI
jgi:hypothetical protein